MSNTERRGSFSPSVSPLSNDGRGAQLERDAAAASESTPATVRAANNPFASFAPAFSPGGSRDLGAETKVYQVPRELIELARARTSRAESEEKITPLAPRPDAALEATVSAYAARLQSAPLRPPKSLLARVESESADADGLGAPPPRSLGPRLSPGPLGHSRPPRIWLFYAALSLLGLGTCVHLLLSS